MIGRIERKNTFLVLRSDGVRVSSGPVLMLYLPTVPYKTSPVQLAFAIGRRHGSAVERNRIRRRLKEAFRQAWLAVDDSELYGAYLVSTRRFQKNECFQGLVAAYQKCFVQLQQQRSEG